MSDISRRALLVAGAGGAGALALAGCASSGGSRSAPTDGARASETSTSSSGSADTSSSSTSSAAGSSSASSATSGGTPLASVSDLTVGDAKSVKLANGKNGIVTLISATSAVAFSARCTHEGCTVKPSGSTLTCPCHQSMFDAKTGAVLQGPATDPLEKVTVTVTGGEVLES